MNIKYIYLFPDPKNNPCPGGLKFESLKVIMQDFFIKRIEDGTVCITGYEGDEPHVVIPEKIGAVTVLYDDLFKGHREITSVRLPDSITDMGEFLFDGCTNLHQIELPARLERLWGYTFARCGIREIILPDSLKTIPPFAFKDCRQLKKAVCGTGLKKIYAWAFSGCDQLSEVVYGPEVEVSPHAFETKK